MLLRRITEHVKAQNWFAVFLDFAIVVIGILIAFQITTWNENRVQREHLGQQLASLRVEFEENLPRFDDYKKNLQSQLDDINDIRAVLAVEPTAADPGAVDAIDAKLMNVFRIAVFAPEQKAMEDLTSNGGLRRLSSKEIRDALSEWEQALAGLKRLEGDALNHRNTAFASYIFGNLSFGAIGENYGLIDSDFAASKFRNDLMLMAQDRVLDNHLVMRYGVNSAVLAYLDELEHITEKLVLILK
ncbi:MAG: hypothetical protein GXP04_01200 [Alphaproteobacteria bacterium]|nr:hypothetical protein [Alphaproteobacteria bacterium]